MLREIFGQSQSHCNHPHSYSHSLMLCCLLHVLNLWRHMLLRHNGHLKAVPDCQKFQYSSISDGIPATESGIFLLPASDSSSAPRLSPSRSTPCTTACRIGDCTASQRTTRCNRLPLLRCTAHPFHFAHVKSLFKPSQSPPDASQHY